MALITRRRRILLPGAVLVGFAELFDRAYGNPDTIRNKDGSYIKVTPARIGFALLPFACPHCGAVRPEAVDMKRGRRYCDEERGFCWCPACQGRYILNTEGRPLDSELPAGATHAPALIERDGKAKVVDKLDDNALDLLGVE